MWHSTIAPLLGSLPGELGRISRSLALWLALRLIGMLGLKSEEIGPYNLVKVQIPEGTLVCPEESIGTVDLIYKYHVYTKVRDIHPNDVVIVVGAHVGIFTLKAAKKARSGLVVAVEPHPLNYRLLLRNIHANQVGNVIPIQAALWRKSGELKLFLSKSSEMHSVIRNPALRYYIRVHAKTLDELVEDLSLQEVDFIKIDAEGSELQILQGAKRTLSEHTPFLSIAAYHTPTERNKLAKFLHKLGYIFIVDKELGESHIRIHALKPRRR